MNIEIKPWLTPDFITAVMPTSRRQDGFNPDNVPKWHVSEVDEETLSEQCDKFREEVFKKAGKKDPKK